MTPRLFILPIAAALALGACGGDDDDPSAADSATTSPSAVSAAPPTDQATDTTTVTTAAVTAEAAPTTGSGADDSGGDFCPQMQEIAEFNGNSPELDPSLPWEEYKAQSMELAASIDLYDPAIEAAPDEIREQLVTLKEITVQGFAALEDSSSFEEFVTAAGELVTEDVQTATTEVDAFLREECGFGLTS